MKKHFFLELLIFFILLRYDVSYCNNDTALKFNHIIKVNLSEPISSGTIRLYHQMKIFKHFSIENMIGYSLGLAKNVGAMEREWNGYTIISGFRFDLPISYENKEAIFLFASVSAIYKNIHHKNKISTEPHGGDLYSESKIWVVKEDQTYLKDGFREAKGLMGILGVQFIINRFVLECYAGIGIRERKQEFVYYKYSPLENDSYVHQSKSAYITLHAGFNVGYVLKKKTAK